MGVGRGGEGGQRGTIICGVGVAAAVVAVAAAAAAITLAGCCCSTYTALSLLFILVLADAAVLAAFSCFCWFGHVEIVPTEKPSR